MKRNSLLLILALMIAACAEGPAQWDANCSTPEARLAAAGIESTEIERIFIHVDRAQEGGVMTRHAWARLKSCTGYVIVRLDAACGASDPYTTGNCRLPQRGAQES